MKHLAFILKHFRRNRVRTLSTIVSITLCIFLFCTLETVIGAINFGLKSADAARLITRHQVSLIFRMPVTYAAKIREVPGVVGVSWANWFGGIYKEPKNFFANFAIDAATYLPLYPEYIISDADKRALLEDLGGCMVGQGLADKFGWKVGDRFQMESSIPYNRKATPFEFTIRAIYTSDEARYPGTNLDQMFFHWKYLDEGTGRRAQVGTYAIKIANPASAGAVSRQIDKLFENTDAPSKTETESAFRAGFISLIGDLTLMLRIIGLAVTVTILIVNANTMTMAVRERRTEIAVLKTLGFPSALVMGLILTESVLLGALGGVSGVGLGSAVVGLIAKLPFIGDLFRGLPSGTGLDPRIIASAIGLALAIGLVAGLVPALLAYRSRIAETLRQV